MTDSGPARLFDFDGVDSDLELLPLATRRVLDGLGVHLGREAHRELPLRVRTQLARCGSVEPPDWETARSLLGEYAPNAPSTSILSEPNAEKVPNAVLDALSEENRLSDKLWQGLSGLERYALLKVCSKGRVERITAAYEELVGQRRVSAHLRPRGGVEMVAVVHKPETERHAVAESWVSMNADAFQTLETNAGPKGDVLATARIAGIQGAKRTSEWIPLCHPLQLLHAEVDFESHPERSALRVVCHVVVVARTGVEMEAMCGVQAAALTVYDMLKSVDRAMTLGPCRLLEKSGGRSGHFRREPGQ